MVLRSRLLGHGAYERLLDAPTFADQRRVLTETHFGRFLDAARTASEVECAIDESLRDLYGDFLHRAGLPAPVIAFFETPYDFSALRSRLRSQAMGVSAELPAARLGGVPLEAFESPETLPGALGLAAREVLKADPPLSAEAIDATVDRVMFGELERLARESRIGLLVRLVSRQADAANAKVLLRSAIAGRSAERARVMLVPGGSWDASAAATLVRDPSALAGAILASRVLAAPSSDDLLDLERLDLIVDAASVSVARDAALGPIGPEPVLGYVLQRMAEATAVRVLLVGRLSNLPRELLTARVRGVAS